MKFQIEVKIPCFKPTINFGDKLCFLGSCFSDEISSKFKNAGIEVLSNPFGTIFNPIPLAQNILDCFSENPNKYIFEYKKQHFSWLCSTKISKNTEKELKVEIRTIQVNSAKFLENASHLFITLGSAWEYKLKETDLIVANCHKQNPNLFEKSLSSLENLVKIWTEVLLLLKEKNPELSLIFTVSPVRHSKDGFTENSRSKARLFELISVLETKFPIQYFPSYEIMQDELRDYRFYKEDMLHPSEQAIQYIWMKVQSSFCSKETQTKMEEVENLRKLSNHQIISENKEEISHFENQKETKINQFLKSNPTIIW